MKKYLLFLLALFATNIKAQQLPCNVLPPEFMNWCWENAWLDTLNLSDDTNAVFIDTSNACNLWQLGNSYKPVFDSASSPFGIVTDTLLSYPVAVNCSFIVKQPLFGNSFWGNPVILFEHKYETDSLRDGGFIDYSCDNGQNWNLINGLQYGQNGYPIQINYHNYLGFPDSYWNQTAPKILDSIPAFTGRNENWEWSGLQLLYIFPLAKPESHRGGYCSLEDTLYIRFNFLSDSIDNGKSGWMIRNIVLLWTDVGGSVNEHSLQPLSVFPNPADETISFELPHELKNEKISVEILDILGNKALVTYKEVPRHVLNISLLSPGVYFLLAKAENGIYRGKFVKQ